MSHRAFRRDVIDKAERMKRARAGSQRIWAGLALTGSIGWMVALPMVGGALLGRWLDACLGTGLSLTLGLLLLGLATGAYLVWRFFLRSMR